MGAFQASLDRREQILTSPAQTALTDAPDVLQLAWRGGLALGYLHQRGVAEHALYRPVSLRGHALAPRDQLARDTLGGSVQAADARQSLEDGVEVALVADALEAFALLARPAQAADLIQAVLQLDRERAQVHDVVAGVVELLAGERARVPAGEARALRQFHAKQRSQQRVV